MVISLQQSKWTKTGKELPGIKKHQYVGAEVKQNMTENKKP